MADSPVLPDHRSMNSSGAGVVLADYKATPRRANVRGHGTEGVTSMQAERTSSRHHDELSLRMLGQNVMFWRCQWEELLDDLNPESETARRITALLERDA